MPRPSRKDFRRKLSDAPAEKTATAENEIKVTAKRSQRSYITYSIALLTGAEDKTKQDTIYVSGMGAAIFNAVNIAEIVKRRVKGIHQITEISSQVVHDSYEAIDKEKNEDFEVDRRVSVIKITLSTKPLDTKNIGYQAPLPDDQVTEQDDRKPTERRPREEGDAPRRGGRGGRGSGRGRGSGESRGRGGSRGRERGDARNDARDDRRAERSDRPEGGSRGGRGSRGGSEGRGRGRGRGDGARGGRSEGRGRGGSEGGRGGRGEGRGRGGSEGRGRGRGSSEGRGRGSEGRGRGGSEGRGGSRGGRGRN